MENKSMEESAQNAPITPKPNPLTTVTALSKALALILFIALPFLGFYLGEKYQEAIAVPAPMELVTNRAIPKVPVDQQPSTPTVSPTVRSPSPSVSLDSGSPLIDGQVLVYTLTSSNMTIQLIANSKVGNITKMKVWTDKDNEPKAWQVMQTLVKIPVSDNVYARFMDEAGNISKVYSDTQNPPQGPPNQ